MKVKTNVCESHDKILSWEYIDHGIGGLPEIPSGCAHMWAAMYYGILLAAIGAVSGVFAYYPHPGGQA